MPPKGVRPGRQEMGRYTPFFVLRGAGMPAVLLETGFVTNLNEAKLLAHPGYQRRIAEAMAEGIVSYLK